MLRDASFKYDIFSNGVRQIEIIAICGPCVSGRRTSPEVLNNEVMSVFHGEESHIRTGHLQQVLFVFSFLSLLLQQIPQGLLNRLVKAPGLLVMQQ
jgi:hypothetical protein